MALSSLVVCTDPKSVEVLCRALRDLGIHMELCTGMAEAASRLTASGFDAILVDCQQERAAIELITFCRRSDPNRSSLAVALVDATNDVRRIFATGANFVIYKPVLPERVNASLRAARGLMRREKRRSRRIRLHTNASISYANVESTPATLLDLSEYGVALQSEARLPNRCKVYFQFALPGQAATVRLSGEVVWQDSAGRVGVRFADVPQTSRRVLKEWMRAHSENEDPDAAPAQPAPAQMAFNAPVGLGLLSVSASDRRIKTRHACRIGADIFRMGVNVPHRCTLSDISIGGCYVETSEPFPVGTSIEIVVRTEIMKVRVYGRVQSTHTAYGMGVEFTLKSPDQRAQVQQLIAHQASASPVS
jgi:CheY-like chemotaxis protein